MTRGKKSVQGKDETGEEKESEFYYHRDYTIGYEALEG